MPGFEDAWRAVSGSQRGEPVSPELKPLLERVYPEILRESPDLSLLKAALDDLLIYLTGTGRSNANCWATDLFFCDSQGWERDWTERGLPDDFHDLLAMMGEALHDTVKNPEIAGNFDCLPKQLLERAKALQT